MTNLAMTLTSRVAIQQRGPAQDEAGQPIEAWSEVATLWAGIRDLSGREYVAAGAERSEVTTKIRIWRRAGITSGMRVVRGSAVYDIKAVLDEARDWTLLMCTKVTT